MQQQPAFFFLFLIALLITGCAGAPGGPLAASGDAQLAFETHVSVGDSGNTVISLGVSNAGDTAFAGDDAFAGVMELRDLRAHTLVVRSEARSLAPLDVGETAFPLGWEGELAPGEYYLIWGAAGYGANHTSFPVIDERHTSVNVATDGGVLPRPGDYGAAQPYVEMARATLAAQRDMKADAIIVQRVEAPPDRGLFAIFLQGPDGDVSVYHGQDGVVRAVSGTPVP